MPELFGRIRSSATGIRQKMGIKPVDLSSDIPKYTFTANDLYIKNDTDKSIQPFRGPGTHLGVNVAAYVGDPQNGLAAHLRNAPLGNHTEEQLDSFRKQVWTRPVLEPHQMVEASKFINPTHLPGHLDRKTFYPDSFLLVANFYYNAVWHFYTARGAQFGIRARGIFTTTYIVEMLDRYVVKVLAWGTHKHISMYQNPKANLMGFQDRSCLQDLILAVFYDAEILIDNGGLHNEVMPAMHDALRQIVDFRGSMNLHIKAECVHGDHPIYLNESSAAAMAAHRPGVEHRVHAVTIEEAESFEPGTKGKKVTFLKDCMEKTPHHTRRTTEAELAERIQTRLRPFLADATAQKLTHPLILYIPTLGPVPNSYGSQTKLDKTLATAASTLNDAGYGKAFLTVVFLHLGIDQNDILEALDPHPIVGSMVLVISPIAFEREQRKKALLMRNPNLDVSKLGDLYPESEYVLNIVAAVEVGQDLKDEEREAKGSTARQAGRAILRAGRRKEEDIEAAFKLYELKPAYPAVKMPALPPAVVPQLKELINDVVKALPKLLDSEISAAGNHYFHHDAERPHFYGADHGSPIIRAPLQFDPYHKQQVADPIIVRPTVGNLRHGGVPVPPGSPSLVARPNSSGSHTAGTPLEASRPNVTAGSHHVDPALAHTSNDTSHPPPPFNENAQHPLFTHDQIGPKRQS